MQSMSWAANQNARPKWEEQFKTALVLRKKKKPEAAIELLIAMNAEHPKTPAILGTLAGAYWDQGNLQRAALYFRQTTRLSPKSELASLGLFHTLWELGRPNDAKKEMIRFLAICNSKEYEAITARPRPNKVAKRISSSKVSVE
jgi:predicted Zn-dependent protease